MAKLKSLTVRGYQSHVDSTFPIAPGLTVITGPSGNGKTSGTIRALRWLAFGEPAGDDFLHTLRDPLTGEVRSQSEQTEVIAELDDGVTIEKIRRKKKTTHKISTIDEPFEKAETPDEVKDALGLNVYNFGDFEAALNFAYQLEAPFLLSESPSAGAKVLGKLAGTEAVDKAIKAVSKDTYAVRQDRDKAQADIEKYTAGLLDYVFLDEAIGAVKTCDDLMVLIEGSDTKRTQLLSLQAKHEKDAAALTEYEARVTALLTVDQAASLMKMLETSTASYTILVSYQGEYVKHSDQVKALTEQLLKYEGVEAAKSVAEIMDQEILKLDKLKELSTLSTGYTQDQKAAHKETLKQQLEIFKSLDELATCYVHEKAAADYVLDSMVGVEKAEDMLQQLGGSSETLATLLAIKADHTKAATILQSADNRLRSFDNVDKAQGMVTSLEDNLATLTRYKELKTTHEWAERDKQSTTEAVVNAIVEVEKMQYDLEQLWHEAGDVCPLCDQPIH